MINQDVNYHIQSIRGAFVREQLGGVAAAESCLMQKAVGELMELHGLSEEEIIAAYRERFPQ